MSSLSFGIWKHIKDGNEIRGVTAIEYDQGKVRERLRNLIQEYLPKFKKEVVMERIGFWRRRQRIEKQAPVQSYTLEEVLEAQDKAFDYLVSEVHEETIRVI